MVFLNYRKVVESLRGIPASVSVFLLTLTLSFAAYANHRTVCPIDLVPTIQHVVCNGERTGSISVAVVGGVAPYTYRWSNGSTSSSLTGLSAGIYAVTVRDATGCPSEVRFEVKQPNALDAQILTNRVRCDLANSGTARASATGGVSPYKYRWNTGDTTALLSNRLAGRYTVTVTDANGCTITKSVLVEDPIFHYTVRSMLIRCVDVPATRRIYMPVRLEEMQTRGVLGLDIEILNVAGFRLDTIVMDTNMIGSVGYFKDSSATKTTVSIISRSSTPVRTIIRDTGRLMWLGFTVENNFVPNVIHDVVLSIRESYDYGWRDACVKLARLSITDDPTAVIKSTFWDNTDKPLYRSAVPTSISIYDRVGNPMGTFLPDDRGFINFDKANASLLTVDRRIADTTPVLPNINGQDAQDGFKIIAGTGIYRSRAHFIFSLLAADVNGDGRITASDLYFINVRSVMSSRHFKWGRRGVDKDWIAITDEMLKTFLTQIFDKDNLPELDREDGFMPLRFAAPTRLCQKDSMTAHWVLLGDVNEEWKLSDIQLRSSKSAELDFCSATETYDGKTVVSMRVKNTPFLTSIYFDLKSFVKIVDVKPQLSALKENHNIWNESSLVSAYVADAYGSPTKDTTTVLHIVIDKKRKDIKPSDFDSIKIWINGQPATLTTIFQNNCIKGGDFRANLFPNPTQDGRFGVKMTVPTLEDVKFELTSLLGQVLETKTYQPTNKQFLYDFDVTDKPDTYYILHVTQGKEKMTLKIAWVK